ncbi:TENX protein, partial [Eudromia elegans]|nr:TENX protein [Eudromia elegans]
LGELTVSDVTPDSVHLEWTVPKGTFDSFVVQYRDEQDQPQVVPVDGESNTVTVSGLVPSHYYKFDLYGVWRQKRLGPVSTEVVTGEGGCGHHPCSLWASILGSGPGQSPSMSLSSTPPQLGDLTAPHVTPTSVQLQWTVPEGSFDSFTVQYKDAQGQPQVVPVDGESRTVTVPNLVPSRRYKFNLYGLWGRKRLGPISTDAVTGEHGHGDRPSPAPSQEEPPSQPQLGDLTASHVTPSSIQLDWTVPEGNFDSFTVQYKDAQGQPQVVPVDGRSRTVTVP